MERYISLFEKELKEANPKKGVKSYYQMDNIGKVKYTINFYDGKSTHKDGSPFYDIRTFKNKSDMEAFIKELTKQGYRSEQ